MGQLTNQSMKVGNWLKSFLPGSLKQNSSDNRDKRQEFLLDRSQIPPFLLRIEQGRACPFLDHALQLSLE